MTENGLIKACGVAGCCCYPPASAAPRLLRGGCRVEAKSRRRLGLPPGSVPVPGRCWRLPHPGCSRRLRGWGALVPVAAPGPRSRRRVPPWGRVPRACGDAAERAGGLVPGRSRRVRFYPTSGRHFGTCPAAEAAPGPPAAPALPGSLVPLGDVRTLGGTLRARGW